MGKREENGDAFADWAGRVVAGEDADEAARAVGGTGRPDLASLRAAVMVAAEVVVEAHQEDLAVDALRDALAAYDALLKDVTSC